MDRLDDEHLLRALQERQPDAFQQVVELHQRQVINICYRFVHDRAEAEDLAQETFLEVYRSVAGFRGQSDIATWIFRIAISKSLDHLRKQSREKRGGKLKAFLGLGGETDTIPAPSATEPDEILAQKTRRRILRQVLASIPESQRIAFVLSKYDGISYQEIANILHTTLPSVESLIHRARKNLRKKLQDHFEKHDMQ